MRGGFGMRNLVPKPGNWYEFRDDESQKYISGGLAVDDASNFLRLVEEELDCKRLPQKTIKFEVFHAPATPGGKQCGGFFVRAHNGQWWRRDPESQLVFLVDEDPRKDVSCATDISAYIFFFVPLTDGRHLVTIETQSTSFQSSPVADSSAILATTPIGGPLELRFDVIHRGNKAWKLFWLILLIVVAVILFFILMYYFFRWFIPYIAQSRGWSINFSMGTAPPRQQVITQVIEGPPLETTPVNLLDVQLAPPEATVVAAAPAPAVAVEGPATVAVAGPGPVVVTPTPATPSGGNGYARSAGASSKYVVNRPVYVEENDHF